MKLIPEYGGQNSFGPLPGLRELLSKPLPPLESELPPLKNDGISSFELVAQPNRKQRKSYQNENRYLLPNPIVVRPLSGVNGIEGTVTVDLLYENGVRLPPGSLEGDLVKSLEGKEKEARFQLKLLVITAKRLRLSFNVHYTLRNLEQNSNTFSNLCPIFDQRHETLLSQPFEVHSNSTRNRKAFAVPQPVVQKIIPTSGIQGVEVWIKGQYFHNLCEVRFGEVWAQLIEISPNLVICRAPFQWINSGRLDNDFVVPLVVYNFQSENERDEGDCLPSNIQFFRYKLGKEDNGVQES